jgi:hypothetical protein
MHTGHERAVKQERSGMAKATVRVLTREPGKLVDVSFESVSAELYGLAPNDFTAARNSRVSEARQSGDTSLAASLKKLHKPTVGAWLVNILARERAQDLERLITFGTELRRGQHGADGEEIRRVSKKKHDAVAKLLAEATLLARNRGQPVSEAAAVDLETTLDAAFADPKAAESVRGGRLTTGLRYSGLGLSDSASEAPVRTSKVEQSGAAMAAAKRELELANREAARADAEVDTARAAVASAESDLKRLKAAADLAVRRATDARKRAASADKKATR